MINKQIFYIWLGKLDPPENMKWVIKNNQENNPDYKIDFIHYKDVFNCDDKLLIKCRDLILQNKEDDPFHGCRIRSKHYKKFLKNNILQKICNLYRIELLYNYGGIYLDCDTYCVENFDKLLDNKYFCVKSRSKDNKITFADNWMLGSEKGATNFPCCSYGTLKCKNIIPTNHIIYNDDPKFQEMRLKFENSNLNHNEKYSDKTIFCDHYDRRTWAKYTNSCKEII